MARKKSSAASVAEAAPATFEDIKKRLIATGKKRGSISEDEIAQAFETLEDFVPEMRDDLDEELVALGIEVVDEPIEVKPDESEPDPIPDNMSLDDPVRMYLKEIGRVPLLSMDDEKRLAMAIEAGDEEKRKNGSADSDIVTHGLDASAS